MALLFFDGFDHGGNDSQATVKKWDAYGAMIGPTTTNARNGVSLRMYVSEDLTKLLPPGTTFILGFALRLGNPPDPAYNLLQFREGATIHMSAHMTAAGLLVIKRGSTPIATATVAVALNSWIYVEVKVVIHDTTGSVVVRFDGVNVPFDASLTGIDTRNGGTGLVDRVVLNGVHGSSPYTMIDDLYICDASGSISNDFLGICAIETLLPQVGNGDLVGLTPSTGTDHGALVGEIPPTDDSGYNTGDTTGQTDSYNYPSLALPGSVLAVQTNLYARKTDAGARTVAPVMRLGGVTYPGTAVAPLTTYRYLPQVWETNPATGLAWTTADVAAMQAGMKVVT